MKSHSYVELILSTRLDEILVGADTSSLQSLRGKLFILVRHQMDAQGEVVHASLLLSQVEDTDLGIRDTTTEPGLRIRLVFAVPITESR